MATSGLLNGRFEVGQRISTSKRTAVCMGHDRSDDRPVVIKFFAPVDDNESSLHEFRLLLDLDHPGIVDLIDTGLDEPSCRPFLIMERLEATPLDVAWPGASAAERMLMVSQMLSAVAYLHEYNVVHGDLKPGNIMVRKGPSGPQPVLIDFEFSVEGGRELQGTTPEYAAPELAAEGARPSPSSDVYSLGVTLMQVALGLQRPRRTLPRGVEIPPALRRILPRMLSRSDAERYSDGGEVAESFARLVESRFSLIVPDRLPLVGALANLSSILATVEGVRNLNEGPSLLSIDGPSGSGRTRLLGEAARRLRAKGILCLSLADSCDIRELILSAYALLGASSAMAQSTLGQLTEGGESAGLGQFSVDQAALAVFGQAYGRFLVVTHDPAAPGSVGSRLIDALHRHERASREAGESARLVIVRTSLGPASESEDATRRDVTIRPLGVESHAHLLRLLTGCPPDAPSIHEIGRLLRAHSGGNPRRLQQLLRHIADTNSLMVRASECRLDAGALDRFDAGDASLRERIDALGTTSTKVLELLSVRRLPTPRSWISSAAGLAPNETSHHLRALERLQLVDLHGGTNGESEVILLPHVIGEVTGALAGGEIPRLHNAWLPVVVGPQQSLHLAGAGRLVGEALLAKVDEALAEGRTQLATELLEQDEASGPEREGAIACDLRRAQILLRLGNVDLAHDLYSNVWERSLSLPSRERCSAALGLAEALWLRGDMREALRIAEEAMECALDPSSESSAFTRTLAFRGFLQIWSGDLVAARQSAELARAHATGGATLDQCRLLNLRGIVALRTGQTETACELLDRARDGFATLGMKGAAATAQANAASVRLRTGELMRAIEDLKASLRTFELGGQGAGRAQALINLGVAQSDSGNYLHAQRHFREAQSLSAGLGNRAWGDIAAASEGMAHLENGDPFRAYCILRDLHVGLAARPRCIAEARLSRALSEMGRVRAARRYALRSLFAARGLRTPRELAEASLAVGVCLKSHERALRWLTRAITFARRGGCPGVLVVAVTKIGVRCWEAGDPAGAELAISSLEGNDTLMVAPERLHPEFLALRLRCAEPDEFRGLLASGFRIAVRQGNPRAMFLLSLSRAKLALEEGASHQAALAWWRARQALSRMENGMTKRGAGLMKLALAGGRLEELMHAIEKRIASLGSPGSTQALGVSEILLSVGRLAGTASRAELLRSIVESAIKIAQADSGFVVLPSSHGDDMQFLAGRTAEGRAIKASRNRVSLSIIQDVFASQKTLVIPDAGRDPRYRELHSVKDNKLRAIICAPMAIQGKTLGVLYLASKSGFQPGVISILEGFGHVAAQSVRHQGELQKSRSVSGRLRQELRQERRRAIVRDAGDVGPGEPGSLLVGRSRALDQVRGLIVRAADSHLSVLIAGETGVGKELVAREYHTHATPDGPFIPLNCSSIPHTLFESELFGHAKGAYTGAVGHPGLARLAEGGVLLLDEIGDCPLELQPKLLRLLEERVVRPVGGTQEFPITARIIAATNRNLREMVREGLFREDLFYRLSALVITVPPLRERRDDVRDLIKHFVARTPYDSHLTPEALSVLEHYDWPGNVRQLENEIERASVIAGAGGIGKEMLSFELRPGIGGEVLVKDQSGKPRTLEDVERQAIEEALRFAGQDRSEAARLLGIGRSTLYSKLKKLHSGGSKSPD